MLDIFNFFDKSKSRGYIKISSKDDNCVKVINDGFFKINLFENFINLDNNVNEKSEDFIANDFKEVNFNLDQDIIIENIDLDILKNLRILKKDNNIKIFLPKEISNDFYIKVIDRNTNSIVDYFLYAKEPNLKKIDNNYKENNLNDKYTQTDSLRNNIYTQTDSPLKRSDSNVQTEILNKKNDNSTQTEVVKSNSYIQTDNQTENNKSHNKQNSLRINRNFESLSRYSNSKIKSLNEIAIGNEKIIKEDIYHLEVRESGFYKLRFNNNYIGLESIDKNECINKKFKQFNLIKGEGIIVENVNEDILDKIRIEKYPNGSMNINIPIELLKDIKVQIIDINGKFRDEYSKNEVLEEKQAIQEQNRTQFKSNIERQQVNSSIQTDGLDNLNTEPDKDHNIEIQTESNLENTTNSVEIQTDELKNNSIMEANKDLNVGVQSKQNLENIETINSLEIQTDENVNYKEVEIQTEEELSVNEESAVVELKSSKTLQEQNGTQFKSDLEIQQTTNNISIQTDGLDNLNTEPDKDHNIEIQTESNLENTTNSVEIQTDEDISNEIEVQTDEFLQTVESKETQTNIYNDEEINFHEVNQDQSTGVLKKDFDAFSRNVSKRHTEHTENFVQNNINRLRSRTKASYSNTEKNEIAVQTDDFHVIKLETNSNSESNADKIKIKSNSKDKDYKIGFLKLFFIRIKNKIKNFIEKNKIKRAEKKLANNKKKLAMKENTQNLKSNELKIQKNILKEKKKMEKKLLAEEKRKIKEEEKAKKAILLAERKKLKKEFNNMKKKNVVDTSGINYYVRRLNKNIKTKVGRTL